MGIFHHLRRLLASWRLGLLPVCRQSGSYRKELTKKASERTFDDHEVVLPGNLDGYEFRDAPGISQRVDDVLGGQFAHDQCQVAFEGCLDRASIDPLHVLRGASTTNHFHHKFCFLHSLLSCLEVLLRRNRCTGEKDDADARNQFSTAGESDQPILFR